MRRNAMIRGIAGAAAMLLLLSSCGGHEDAPPEPTPTPTMRLLIPEPEHEVPTPEPTPTVPPDTVPPVISGTHNLSVEIGGTVSYRTGVTAVDDVDGTVPFTVDTSLVDLTAPGVYPVIYNAVDAAGNVGEAIINLTVLEPEPTPTPDPVEEQVNAKVDEILPTIINDDMTQREKAEAIFKYISTHVWYVSVQDDGWANAALYALKNQKGDCYNYWALSKAMLGRAGIPTLDVERMGGNSDHYWVLVDVGDEDGWYHFDPCPHPDGHPITCCLLREDEVYAYSQKLNLYSNYYKNYYGWDIENCPVKVAGADLVAQVPQPTRAPATPAPKPTPTPEPTPEPAPEPTVEEPVETEAPAEPEVPVETETPAEPETPVETEAPAEPEAPVETEVPTEPEPPADPGTGEGQDNP